jgi:hypothetical protein
MWRHSFGSGQLLPHCGYPLHKSFRTYEILYFAGRDILGGEKRLADLLQQGWEIVEEETEEQMDSDRMHPKGQTKKLVKYKLAR